jgi:hypothetical protein
MPNLQLQDITTFFVVIDDSLENTYRTGRKPILSGSEIVTILLWCSFVLCIKTLKEIYDFIRRYHRKEFPRLPDYSAFVRCCHKASSALLSFLQRSLGDSESSLRFVDSTMLPVCKTVRADSHKVAKGIAAFGKNHQGWHYGFKLHATVNKRGHLCGIALTSANIHDAQAVPSICDKNAKIIVGDGGYSASIMREKLWKEKGVFLLAPPHPKQKKKILSPWQHLLLQMRPKVESMFDILKEHMHLVTSFPRSIMGYLLHYLRILVGYQFKSAFC